MLQQSKQLKGSMQEAGMSILLVFAPVVIFELYACRSIMQISNLYARNVIFLWAFFTTMYILICMVDARRSPDFLVTVSTRNLNNTRRSFCQKPTFRVQQRDKFQIILVPADRVS